VITTELVLEMNHRRASPAAVSKIQPWNITVCGKQIPAPQH